MIWDIPTTEVDSEAVVSHLYHWKNGNASVVEQHFGDHLATEVNKIDVDLNTNTLNLVKVIAHIQK